jgi:hypothetical protein
VAQHVLPKASPGPLTTIRQETARTRAIAGLFLEGRAAEALAMKRKDGTAMLVGGDQGFRQRSHQVAVPGSVFSGRDSS